MPLNNGVFTPISSITAQGMYKMALQILRGQASRPLPGDIDQRIARQAADRQHAIARMTDRYLRGQQVMPADRARMQQIINQAANAHDVGLSLNDPNQRATPLSQLNIDPTIEPGSARVRYRVVVTAIEDDGTRRETRVLIDSATIMDYDAIKQAAIDQVRRTDPLRGRKYDIFRDAPLPTQFEAIIIGAGKSR